MINYERLCDVATFLNAAKGKSLPVSARSGSIVDAYGSLPFDKYLLGQCWWR